jgi:hypothetical protein
LPEDEVGVSELFTNRIEDLVSGEILFRLSFAEKALGLKPANHGVFKPKRPQSKYSSMFAIGIVKQLRGIPQKLEGVTDKRNTFNPGRPGSLFVDPFHSSD